MIAASAEGRRSVADRNCSFAHQPGTCDDERGFSMIGKGLSTLAEVASLLPVTIWDVLA